MTEPTNHSDPAQTVRGKCGKCDHVWIVAYLPMDIPPLVRIMRAARCPMCANGPKRVCLTDDPPTPLPVLEG